LPRGSAAKRLILIERLLIVLRASDGVEAFLIEAGWTFYGLTDRSCKEHEQAAQPKFDRA